MDMKTFVFRVDLEREDDGRWSASVPTLPGCATWGYSKEEAMSSLREAAQAYLELLFAEGGSLPKEVEGAAEVIPAPAVAVTL
ncbi:MAG: type II toxin-antitoxin system HicB family antitoxin [Chloroflexi bacterium]|nr:type II toxin-antitoxin system HicB family antitoxin [Chloroflexota bacterium]MBI4506050.1 type II toxin-antitoxin system HicB family antitoxin [Chloroflexota bacterium]